MKSCTTASAASRHNMLDHGCPRRSQCLVAMQQVRHCNRNNGMACDPEAPIGQTCRCWNARFAKENGIADAGSFVKKIRARGRSLSLMRCTYFRTTFQSTMPLWSERKNSPSVTKNQFCGSSPKTSHISSAIGDCQETQKNRKGSNGYKSMT